jgi:hypothetical protein
VDTIGLESETLLPPVDDDITDYLAHEYVDAEARRWSSARIRAHNDRSIANCQHPRELIARKALSLLLSMRSYPELQQDEMEEAQRILMDANLLERCLKPMPPEEFVMKVFRDNWRLDEATGYFPLRLVKSRESLSELAHLLTPPYRIVQRPAGSRAARHRPNFRERILTEIYAAVTVKPQSSCLDGTALIVSSRWRR